MKYVTQEFTNKYGDRQNMQIIKKALTEDNNSCLRNSLKHQGPTAFSEFLFIIFKERL